MRFLLFPILFLFLFCLRLSAQDTVFYNSQWNEVPTLAYASYYEIIPSNPTDTGRYTGRLYYQSGQIKSEKNFSNYKRGILDGKLKEWFENGQLKRDVNYTHGLIDGKVLTFYQDGKPKRSDVFKNGKFQSGTCFHSNGKKIKHFDYEIPVSFPGGSVKLFDYLKKNIRYPLNAKKNKTEGIVYVHFNVNADGSLSHVLIVQSQGPELDAEAMRVINKMPKWEPALIDGEAVRQQVNLPVKFQLLN